MRRSEPAGTAWLQPLDQRAYHLRRRVFIAGATGVAGRRTVRALVEAGHRVTGVARSDKKARALSHLGATPVAVDLFDPKQVQMAIENHDAVVNLATRIPPLSKTMLPGAWSENDRLRSVASRHLVDAALAAGVGTYVQESLAFMYPDHGDRWIHEDLEPAPPPYAETVLEAESQAHRVTEQGGRGTVLRFGQFYAPDAGHTLAAIKLARSRVCPYPGPPSSFLPVIHADDVGSAVVTALDAPAGTYNVVDDEPLRQRQLADILSDALGFKPLRFVPTRLIKLGGSKVEMLMRSQRVSNARFHEATGWTPRFPSARQGLPAVIKEVDAHAK